MPPGGIRRRNPLALPSKDQAAIDLKMLCSLPLHQQASFTRAFLKKPRFLIDPCRGDWYDRWGLLVFIATGLTAVVTPGEGAFFPPAQVEMSFRFFVNMALNLIFFLDMVTQFFAMYHDGDRWVKSWQQIVCKYLHTWFTVDFVALIPFDLVGFNGMRGTRILRCLRPL